MYLPIIVTLEPQDWDPRHTTPDELFAVASWRADEGSYINLPAGMPAIRWIAYRVREGKEIDLNNQRYNPAPITTIDGVPCCEWHAMTAMQERTAPRRPRY